MGNWWQNYSGESALILDDYNGYLQYTELLRVLDRYAYQVQIKGGFVWAQWNTVIITSNTDPKEWYTRGMTPALFRRLTKCEKWTWAADGTVRKINDLQRISPEGSAVDDEIVHSTTGAPLPEPVIYKYNHKEEQVKPAYSPCSTPPSESEDNSYTRAVNAGEWPPPAWQNRTDAGPPLEDFLAAIKHLHPDERFKVLFPDSKQITSRTHPDNRFVVKKKIVRQQRENNNM